jgi:hypothetical protein
MKPQAKEAMRSQAYDKKIARICRQAVLEPEPFPHHHCGTCGTDCPARAKGIRLWCDKWTRALSTTARIGKGEP